MITCHKPKPTPTPKPTPSQNENQYYVETTSIPSTAPANGYTWDANGKITTFNCNFLIFSTINLKGVDGSNVSSNKGETSYGFSATFTELPCDSFGSILAISHYFTKNDSNSKVKLSILCASEPTHTVNLGTGVVTPITTSKYFIKNVGISYHVAAAKKQGC